MLWVECYLANSYVVALTLIPENMTVFGSCITGEAVSSVKMSMCWSRVGSDFCMSWSPYKKRNLDRDMYVEVSVIYLQATEWQIAPTPPE